jgi:cobalt/nickel transport system permease protein
MHISDGVLPPALWLGGYVVAGASVAAVLRRFDERRLPQVAVLTSLFFVCSLIHVPLAGTSVHLLLTGLLGIVLGWLSVPALLVALFFQAVLLGHGGLTTIGVNTVTMGAGALTSHWMFVGLSSGRRSRPQPLTISIAAFSATFAGVVVSGSLFVGVLAMGGSSLGTVAGIVIIPYLAVGVLDGLVTASAVVFLLRVKPELLGRNRCGRALNVAPPRETVARTSNGASSARSTAASRAAARGQGS